MKNTAKKTEETQSSESTEALPKRGKGRPRRKETDIIQQTYIAEYIKCLGRKALAARNIGISIETVYKWKLDPNFQAKLEAAEEEWYDMLKASLMKRAMEKSDLAAFAILSAREPEKYDQAIRKAMWLSRNGVDDPERQPPMQITFVREAKIEGGDVVVNGNGYHKAIDIEVEPVEN